MELDIAADLSLLYWKKSDGQPWTYNSLRVKNLQFMAHINLHKFWTDYYYNNLITEIIRLSLQTLS